MLEREFRFLTPVETVKVTADNMAEVAEWCGGSVGETASRRYPNRMDAYVWVPTPNGTALSWAFPNMFITKRLVINVKNELRASFAVFRGEYFEANYFDDLVQAMDATWERQAKEALEAKTELRETQGFQTQHVVRSAPNRKDRGKKPAKKQPEFLSKAELEKASKKIDETPRVPQEDTALERNVKTSVDLDFAPDPQDETQPHPADGIVDVGPRFKGMLEGMLGVGGDQKEVASTQTHTHSLDAYCEDDCTGDRYANGMHDFTDARVVASPEGPTAQHVRERNPDFITMEQPETNTSLFDTLKDMSPGELDAMVTDGKITINQARRAQGLEPVLEDNYTLEKHATVDDMPTVSEVKERLPEDLQEFLTTPEPGPVSGYKNVE